jgi:hypothetical protein
MKKILFVLLLLVLAMQTASFASLETKNVESGLVFLDIPLLSAVHHDANKQITGFTGINGALGISHRAFFEPVKTNQWNNHWDIGTIILLIPYVGIGTDYVWDNGWYAGIGTFYIIPEVHAGIYF